jgi:hypothetical protein
VVAGDCREELLIVGLEDAMFGHVRTVAARSAGSPLRRVTRWLPRAVLVACVATLVAAVVDALSAGKD